MIWNYNAKRQAIDVNERAKARKKEGKTTFSIYIYIILLRL